MESNREKRVKLKALLREAFENQLRVALIQPVDSRYSQMSGFGQPSCTAGETREVEPRKHTSSAQSD